jgi:hypothetical protein
VEERHVQEFSIGGPGRGRAAVRWGLHKRGNWGIVTARRDQCRFVGPERLDGVYGTNR